MTVGGKNKSTKKSTDKKGTVIKVQVKKVQLKKVHKTAWIGKKGNDMYF